MKYEFSNGSSIETIENAVGVVRGKNHWNVTFKSLKEEILNYINQEAEDAQEEYFSIPFEVMADKFYLSITEVKALTEDIKQLFIDSPIISYVDCKGNEFTFSIHEYLIDNQPETKECYKCHETIDIDNDYCPFCGAYVD